MAPARLRDDPVWDNATFLQELWLAIMESRPTTTYATPSPTPPPPSSSSSSSSSSPSYSVPSSSPRSPTPPPTFPPLPPMPASSVSSTPADTTPRHAQGYSPWSNSVPDRMWNRPPPTRRGLPSYIRYSVGFRRSHEDAVNATELFRFGFHLGPLMSPVPEENWYLSVQRLWADLYPDRAPRKIACQFFGVDLPSDTKLVCERCHVSYSIHLEPIPRHGAGIVKILPYIHCPNNRDGSCKESSIEAWINYQKAIQKKKKEAGEAFRTLLSRLPVGFLSLKVYEQSPDGASVDAESEIYMAYLACRKFWIQRCFMLENGKPVGIPANLAFMIPELETMQLWGDISADLGLYKQGVISAETFKYMYEVSVEHSNDLAFYPKWHVQRHYLNDYVGRRRDLPKNQFHVAKRAAQRIAVAMEKLYIARMAHPGKPDILAAKQHIAFNRFEEMRSALSLFTSVLHFRLSPAPLPRSIKKAGTKPSA